MSEASQKSTPRPEGSWLRWVALVALVVGGLWLGTRALQKAAPEGAPPAPGGGRPPATVIVAPVRNEEIQEHRRVTGTLRAVGRARVAAREAGAIETVQVDEGDSVEAGAILAMMDVRRIDAERAETQALLTAAEALVVQREAETKRATSDLAMKQGLIEERAVSQRELLDSERAEAVARAQEAAAREQVAAIRSQGELLEVRRGDLSIVSPFRGRVVERHVDPGEWLTAGDPVVTVVSAGTIEARLSVPERFAGAITNGALRVTIEGLNRTVDATGIRKVSDVDARTRLFPVVAELDDLEGTLVPGMSVYAELPVGELRPRLGVPNDAVLESQTRSYVYRPAPAGSGPPLAEQVTVRVVFRKDGVSWLESEALQAGDRVIVEGNERLFPGTPLNISESGARANGSSNTSAAGE